MTTPAEVSRLLELLATHPVLPLAEALPANDEGFHALLADLARGEASSRAEALRETSAALAIPIEELARRAEFLLACLVLPASGTYYEQLGVAPTATPQEIRKRWALLIQRYHPDHLRAGSPASGGLDSQARRLIEAYQTLKDPTRRCEYDARLASERNALLEPASRPPGAASGPSVVRAGRWRWAPAGIAVAGLVVGLWVATRPAPRPLPRAPLPAAPKLLETWGVGSGKKEEPSGGAQGRISTSDRPPADSTAPAALFPPRERLAGVADALPGRPASAADLGQVPPGSRPPEPAPRPTGVSELPATPSAGAPAGSAGPLAAAALVAPSAPVAPAPVAVPSPSRPTPLSAEPLPAGSTAGPSTALGTLTGPATSPAPPMEPVRLSSPGPGSAPTTYHVAAPQTVAAPPEAAGGSGSPGSVAAVTAAPVADPLGLVELFRGAYERKDLGTMMALFAAEPREGDVAGRAALEQLYARNFATLREIRYELAQLDVQPATVAGDVVVAGRYRIWATRIGGSPLDVGGQIRWVLRREGGGLRIGSIRYDVSSARAAAIVPSAAAVTTTGVEPARVSTSPRSPSPRSEVLAVIEAFRGAYERKDLQAVMGLLGSEPRDRDVTGRRAVEQLFARDFATFEQIRYELGQLEVEPPAGEAEVVVEGRFRLRAGRLRIPSRALDVAGPIRWLLRRESGAFRIVSIEYEVVCQ